MRYKAMTYFAVDTLKINNQMESLSGIYRELLNEAREIQQLALNLDSDMKKHREETQGRSFRICPPVFSLV